MDKGEGKKRGTVELKKPRSRGKRRPYSLTEIDNRVVKTRKCEVEGTSTKVWTKLGYRREYR